RPAKVPTLFRMLPGPCETVPLSGCRVRSSYGAHHGSVRRTRFSERITLLPLGYAGGNGTQDVLLTRRVPGERPRTCSRAKGGPRSEKSKGKSIEPDRAVTGPEATAAGGVSDLSRLRT